MRKFFPIFGLLSLLLLTACQAEGGSPGAYSFTLVLEGSHVYGPEDRLPGTLAILGGQVELGEGAQVDGPIILLGGDLRIEGQVSKEVSAIGGELVVGPSAVIEGDLRAGSGKLELSPQAQVNGQVFVGSTSGLELDNLFPERSPRDQLPRMIPAGLLLAGLASLGVNLVPSPLNRVRRAAIQHPVISIAMGLLVGIVAPALLVVMAYTLILIPITLLGILMGILVVGFGYVALGMEAGRALQRFSQQELRPPLAAFLGTFVFWVILSLLALIPGLGAVISLVFAALALGAVALTRFGLREFIPESAFEPET